MGGTFYTMAILVIRRLTVEVSILNRERYRRVYKAFAFHIRLFKGERNRPTSEKPIFSVLKMASPKQAFPVGNVYFHVKINLLAGVGIPSVKGYVRKNA